MLQPSDLSSGSDLPSGFDLTMDKYGSNLTATREGMSRAKLAAFGR